MISGSKNCIVKLFFKVVVRIQNLYRAMFQILTIHWYIRFTILLFVIFHIWNDKQIKWIYLLWRDIKWNSSEVHLFVRVHTWHDKKQAWAFRSTRSQTTQSKNNRPFVFLYHLSNNIHIINMTLILWIMYILSINTFINIWTKLTFTVTQRENGIVTRTRIKENIVSSIAHIPGPSGSAAKV